MQTLQETIARAFSKIGTLRNDRYAKTWLTRILINYCGTLMLLDHKGGQYQITDPAKLSGTDCDYVNWDGVSNTETMAYSDVSEDYGNEGNDIPSLAPGKSIQIHMAWIVNENQLDHLYLNLNGDGNAFAFNDTLTRSGIVDIHPAVPRS